MPITITARHASITEEIKDHAREKLESLEPLWSPAATVHLIIEAEKAGYLLEINLQSGHHRINCRSRSRSLQTAVNQAAGKFEKKLKKIKDKSSRRWKNKIRAPYFVDDRPEDIPRLIKEPGPVIESLGEREASLRLREGNRSFLVFRNADGGTLSIIFRRDDGALGLLEIE
ncbi:MAG: ribosome-associated translation inhibitor RaiA [PVC group bacterium]